MYCNRIRLISVDNIEFGVKSLGTDFIDSIIDDAKESEVFVYISLPFPSSTVLDFLKGLKSEHQSSSSDVHQLKTLLGYQESDVETVDMSLETEAAEEEGVNDHDYNDNDASFVIKVELANESLVSNRSIDLNESLPNNENDISEEYDNLINAIDTAIEEFNHDTNRAPALVADIVQVNETVAENVVEHRCSDDTLRVNETFEKTMQVNETLENTNREDDVCDNTVQQYTFTELNDEVFDESENCSIEKPKVVVQVATKGIPFIKDLQKANKKKRKRGC